MASTDSDMPKSVPSSSATPSPSASGSTTSSTHRSCPRCARRMSSLKFDKHSTCVKCRDNQCSVDVRCNECKSWSVDFMLGYVKHQKSLVSEGGKKAPSSSSSSSSPSKPPVVTSTVPPPTPALPAGTEDQLKTFVQSFLSDLISQSGQLGTNPLVSAPAVPNSASLLREVAGCLSADTPTEVPLTESPGKVLPTTQEDHPPPDFHVHDVSSLVRGVASSGGGGGGPLSRASAKVLGVTVWTNCESVVVLWIHQFLLCLLCLLLLFSFLSLILGLLLFPLPLLLLLSLLALLLLFLLLFLRIFLLPLPSLLTLLLSRLLCRFFLLFLILLALLFFPLTRGFLFLLLLFSSFFFP